MKMLYEKMDCLNLCNFTFYLVKKILDFNIEEVVVTLFYLQTKYLDA